MTREWDLIFRPPRWVSIRLVVVVKEAEGEFEEDDTKVVQSRCNAELVYLYYPSYDPNWIVVFLAYGDCMRIVATMEEAAKLFELPKDDTPLLPIPHPGKEV